MRKKKRLVLARETIQDLDLKDMPGVGGFTGPDCDSIEPWWSCTCTSPLDQ
ncbi:MAG TPA: hypothetical protein VHU81_07195 [Thermoanaerobaculia bacterium]|nr:hypothetical protein [Thermoanaerobaculia bacterium]